MNLFILSKCPDRAAQFQCDKHVVKMVLETAQLLCTAHRMLDGEHYNAVTKNGRRVSRWKLNDEREDKLYQAAHVAHPCTKWVQKSDANYHWAFYHFVALLEEYSHRYGKTHKSDELVEMLEAAPSNIRHSFYPSSFVLAMTHEPQCIDHSDPVKSYRDYYHTKQDKFNMKWTNRKVPYWFKAKESI